MQSDEEYEQKDRKVVSEKQKKDDTFKSIISKIKTDLNNVDFKSLQNDFENLRKEIENSKQFFEKEGRPQYIIKVLAEIEEGISKGSQGKKLAKDN